MYFPKGFISRVFVMYLCCFAAYFFVYFHRVSPAVTATGLQNSFEIGSVSLGLLSSVYFYAYALMQLPAGLLSDYLGPRKTISIALLVASVGSISFGIANSFGGAVFGRMLVGFGMACIFVPTVKLFTVWSAPERLATLMGVLMLVGNIGAISASYPLSKAMVIVGWRMLFVLVGLFTLFLALINYLSIRDYPVNLKKHLPGVPIEKNISVTFLHNLLNIEFGLLALWLFCFNGTIFALQGLWGGPLLTTCYNLDTTAVGYILMYFGIGFCFGALIMGKLFDASKNSKIKLLFAGSIAYTIVWLLFTIYMEVLSVPLIIVVFFTLGFLGSSVIGALSKAKEMYPLSYTGTVVGALNTIGFIGVAFWQQFPVLVIERPMNLASFKIFMTLCLAGLIVSNIALLCNIKHSGNSN